MVEEKNLTLFKTPNKELPLEKYHYLKSIIINSEWCQKLLGFPVTSHEGMKLMYTVENNYKILDL